MKSYLAITFAVIAWSALLRGPAEAAGAAQISPSLSTEGLPHLGPLDGAPGPEELLEKPIAARSFDETLSSYWDDAGLTPTGPRVSACDPAYGWHLMPQGLIYRSYLAGAQESRFRSVWHEEQDIGSIWDITLGGNVGLLRYGTTGGVRPEGWQLGIEGSGQVRLDVDEDRDVMASDYRFGIPITWGDSIHQVKFAYYHVSSHLGDEFLLKNSGYPRLNFSRDALVLGHSLYPSDEFRVYAEVGYAFYADVTEPWEFQLGVDYAPAGRTGARGAPFAALNAHLREEVDFGGNMVAQAGWAWRRSPASGMYRIGVEYYNGKDDQFSFFNESLQKIGFGMWYDY